MTDIEAGDVCIVTGIEAVGLQLLTDIEVRGL